VIPLPLDATGTSGSHSTSAEIVMQYLDTVYKTSQPKAVLAAMNIEAS